MTLQNIIRKFPILWNDFYNFKIATSAETVSNITVQGTTDATTAKMIWGVNVITVATNTDYCARLPYPPVQGKTLTIINTSSRTITVFPSITGGSINGVVDGSAVIPNDSKPYIFTCWENPLPGAWTWTPPAINQIELLEMTISHTYGAADAKYGVTEPLHPIVDCGISTDMNGNIVISTPAVYKSLLFPATCTKAKVYTNIVAGDIPSNQQIVVERIVYYKTAVNGAADAGANEYMTFNDTPGQTFSGNIILEAPVGTLTPSPNELVGDTGTFYSESQARSGVSNQLGTGGAFSSYYWRMAIHIPSNAITKNYKFKIFIEYF